MKESTFSREMEFNKERKSGFVDAVGCVGVGGKRNSAPTEDVNATISTPWESERYFSAIEPAATRPVVKVRRHSTIAWSGVVTYLSSLLHYSSLLPNWP